MLEVRRMDDEPALLHIGQQDFEVEEETGYVTVPKELLAGFRLSEIPADIIIKAVDKIEGHTIHIANDVAFSQFSGGSASAAVEARTNLTRYMQRALEPRSRTPRSTYRTSRRREPILRVD